MITNEEVVGMICSRLESFLPLAESLGKSRFLVYKSEYGVNDKEASTMDAIADSFRAELAVDGQSVTLKFHMDENDPGGYLEIVDAGMPTPLLGGDRGTAHNPDSSTYKSQVPIGLWGLPADDPEDLAKPASGVVNEIKMMLAGLFRQYFQEAVADAKKDILQRMKEETKERIGGIR